MNKIDRHLADIRELDGPGRDAAISEFQQLFNGFQPAEREQPISEDDRLSDWRLAVECVLASVVDGGTSAGRDSAELQHVQDLLWRPLKRSSVVLRAWEPDRQRDEDAVIEVARYLSRRPDGFPNCEIRRAVLNGNAKTDPLEDIVKPHHNVCFIGRPGIFGPQATRMASSPDTRFYFPLPRRPQEAERGELVEQYHQVRSRSKLNEDVKQFSASDIHGTPWERTDYAVVQKFRHLNRDVVVCAGCSTFGTLAAARWATRPDTGPIALPPDAATDSSVEVLLKVQGPRVDYPKPWEIQSAPEVVEMWVGDLKWGGQPSAESAWRPCPDKIAVSPSTLEIEIDGQLIPTTKPESADHLTFYAFCRLGKRTGGFTGQELQAELDGLSAGMKLKAPSLTRAKTKLGWAVEQDTSGRYFLNCNVVERDS